MKKISLSSQSKLHTFKLIKDIVRYREGSKCRICTSPHALQFHHIMYRRQNGNNAPCNLVLVCSKCHKLVHGKEALEWQERLLKWNGTSKKECIK